VAISKLIASPSPPIYVSMRPQGLSAFKDEKEVGTWEPVAKGNTHVRAVVNVSDNYNIWLAAAKASDRVKVV